MPIPSDAHYTDRNRHNVRLGDGRIVPRATAENIAARAGGFRSNYERRQAFRAMKKNPEAFRTARQMARERGISAREADELQARMIADVKRSGWRNRDLSPHGPLAEWLRAIGRKTDDKYYVGESP